MESREHVPVVAVCCCLQNTLEGWLGLCVSLSVSSLFSSNYQCSPEGTQKINFLKSCNSFILKVNISTAKQHFVTVQGLCSLCSPLKSSLLLDPQDLALAGGEALVILA